MKVYLCVEYGEFFHVKANNIKEAHEEAAMWGAQVVGELREDGSVVAQN